MVLDAVTTATNFIDVFLVVYILVLLVYALTSWIRLPYSLRPVQRFLNDVCDPYLALWRRILPQVGPLDFSVMAGILGLIVLRVIVVSLLNRVH